jgi:hypothetical protein
MVRCAPVGAAVVVVVVVGALAFATSARTAPTAGAVCKSFSAASGLKPRWSVIGNVSCSKAKPWLVTILADHGKPSAKAVIKNGPRGFHCSAFDDAKGRPSVGSCYTGTAAFPKNGFQWLS